MRIQITIDGRIYPISRDGRDTHPAAVHAAMGTTSETELQAALGHYMVADYYDEAGRHLGPDADGVELIRD